MTQSSETRSFKVDPANIIQHLIRSQAGSFGKAMVESVMNSMDAGATEIRIDVDSASYTITDNGHGLRTREEILKCFEVFSFVHDDRDRHWGRFGLGRAQAFNWASNVWRTRSFQLDVDIRAKGLDYELTSNLPDYPGLRIEGKFYEPLTEVDKLQLVGEVESLCRFVQVPVIFNGRPVQRDVKAQKWTFEDESFYLKAAEGTTLAVYSQGVFVREYPSHQLGVGGVLVTKLGHPLDLNMSRSDVLTHQCALWARVRKVLRDIGTNAAKSSSKKARLTDEQRDFLAAESADPANAHHLGEKLLQLSDGRFISPVALGGLMWRGGVVLTVAERGHPLADAALQEKSAVVVTDRTLSRFGVDSVMELVDVLVERMTRSSDAPMAQAGRNLRYARESGRVYDDFTLSPVYRRLDASTVPENEWTKAEKAVIVALRDVCHRVGYIVRAQLVQHGKLDRNDLYRAKPRRVCVGQGASIEAFTDGSTFIALDRQLLHDTFKGGLGAMQRVLAVLVHEYIHDASSEGTHQHDHEFYAVFHDVMCDKAADLHDLACTAFRIMSKARDRLSRRQAADLDRIEQAA